MTAAEPGFDRERANALVSDLGATIPTDPNYAARAWTGIALVVEIAERRRLYGFVYTARDWEAETPEDFAAFMVRADKCWSLSRSDRPAGPALNIAFDYGDETIWRVTPANHAAMAERLRPV